jgi:3',5'-cyclic AMP phosphodiesterase CpdA
LTRRRWFLAAALALCACLATATARTAAPVLSFGVIADVQYRDADPQGTRFYRDSRAKLEQAVESLNAATPAFVVQLGDLIDGAFLSYDIVVPIYDRLKSPHYHVLGNHDVAVEPERQRSVLQRLGLDRLGAGRGYYDFARSGWRFIVLNGDDLSVQAYATGSPERAASERVLADLRASGAKNATQWNGGLAREQLDWLKRTLARANASHERAIVFCHFPVFPAGDSTLWNDRDVIAILETSPSVVAYFCGHKHEGGYAARNGIHYVNLKGMVEGRETAYAVVELYADSMKINGYGREENRTLVVR